MYALRAAPPPTALAALANRISSTYLGTESALAQNSPAREEWLKKIEMCCTCPSFWNVVKEEERQEDIRKFQREQLGINTSPSQVEVDPETGLPLSQTRYTNYLDHERLHNEALATLGNHLLGVFAIEWLEARYPRLPTT